MCLSLLGCAVHSLNGFRLKSFWKCLHQSSLVEFCEGHDVFAVELLSHLVPFEFYFFDGVLCDDPHPVKLGVLLTWSTETSAHLGNEVRLNRTGYEGVAVHEIVDSSSGDCGG